ncbi:predicted TIM-barrel fold metal-dependent hydrolase [Bacillus oleivorans]|uniref:Predicted TIM-barrel fold metal-dependent hydrolase n=1 Tax=Bacillus oleivorans TaxID=1448271 RepID=A0A285D6Q1_9BACI|nr:amidohydrolase family protein [Bacillus oleivorans]SNX75514.1 predicted TIM-barrel fold metal-dependent hydrolase [Bacillus oleivorans]
MVTYIDCDVHPWVNDIKQLHPFMDKSWIKRFEDQKLNLGSFKLASRYVHPRGSTSRYDAKPPSGGYPGSDLDYMKEQYLDEFNPEVVLLIPQQANSLVSLVDSEQVMALARAFNDYFIETWLPENDKLRYALVAPPHNPQSAAEEIRRVGNKKGVVAVLLPLLNILMGNHYYDPIYEAAVEVGLPVITHPNGQEGSAIGAPVLAGGIQNTYNDRFINLSQIAQSNLTSLIFDGTFEKFPTLKVGFVEYGFTWLLPLMWKMDTVWKALRTDTPWVKKLPSQYVYDHVKFTTQPIEEVKPSDLNIVIEMMNGKNLLMYSSDYPHWDNDMPTRILRGLDPEMKQNILYNNAKEFYHL